MIIDISMDHVPEDLFSNETYLNGFISCAPRAYGWIAKVKDTEKGAKQLVLEKPEGMHNLNYVDGDYSLEIKLKAMDENGVDKAVIRMPVWQEWLPIELCRMINDEAADIAKRSGGRLLPAACVPPWESQENIDELHRCVNELGMKSVQLSCHYGEIYLDDPAFRPMLKAINDLDIPVFVRHTALPVDYHSILDYTNLRRLTGRMIDQAVAVGREVCSDLFDECPNLKMVHSQLGGHWYVQQKNMIPPPPKADEAMNRLESTDHNIMMRRTNCIYLEATHPSSFDPAIMKCAIEISGADHILWGSSFPVFYNWLTDGVKYMKEIDIAEEDRALIIGGNAERLLKVES